MTPQLAVSLQLDGRTLSDTEVQEVARLVPALIRTARRIEQEAPKGMTRGELTMLLAQIGNGLTELQMAVLRGAVVQDEAEASLDDKRRHVVAIHANAAGMELPEDELDAFHDGDHAGPGGIRFHNVKDYSWSAAKFKEIMDEAAKMDSPSEEELPTVDISKSAAALRAEVEKLKEKGTQ
jgi:hypothetical protein